MTGVTKLNLSRRQICASLAAASLLPGCSHASAADTLRVGSQKGGTKALMLASRALDGIDYKVEWAEFPAAQNLLEAVGNNAVDVGVAGDAPFLFAYQSGLPIKAVSAQRVDPRPSEAVAILVPRGSSAKVIADLRGKRIATTRGSIGYYLTLRALAAAGLPRNAVTFTWLSPGDTRAAFASGTVDAWATWIPYTATAMKEGARVLVDGRDLVAGYAFEVANERAIAGKRPLLADFLDREARALQWAIAHPSDYAKLLSAETGLPYDIAFIMVKKHNRHRVAMDEQLLIDQRTIIETLSRSGDIKPERKLENAFENI